MYWKSTVPLFLGHPVYHGGLNLEYLKVVFITFCDETLPMQNVQDGVSAKGPESWVVQVVCGVSTF